MVVKLSRSKFGEVWFQWGGDGIMFSYHGMMEYGKGDGRGSDRLVSVAVTDDVLGGQ